jgi:hypothetical protein
MTDQTDLTMCTCVQHKCLNVAIEKLQNVIDKLETNNDRILDTAERLDDREAELSLLIDNMRDKMMEEREQNESMHILNTWTSLKQKLENPCKNDDDDLPDDDEIDEILDIPTAFVIPQKPLPERKMFDNPEDAEEYVIQVYANTVCR